MNFEGSLRVLKEGIDVTPLISFCNQLTEADWDAWSFRQNTYRIHQNTRSFPLVWSDNGQTIPVPERANTDSPLWTLVQPHLDFLSDLYKGSVSKAMLANLAPDGYIPPHRDLISVLQRIHRCHLPVITGPDVEFVLDGEIHYLAAGSLYEINNQREHSVFNGMPTGRVHLIIDILPDSGDTGELTGGQDARLSRIDNITMTT